MAVPWAKIQHFVPAEFDYPDLLDERLVLTLDVMRKRESGIIFTINSDYRPGDPRWHGKGKAVDGVMRDAKTHSPLPIYRQFVIANRYMFTGIGIYPYWTSPGVHLDVRPMSLYGRKSFWWKDRNGVYRKIEDFF